MLKKWKEDFVVFMYEWKDRLEVIFEFVLVNIEVEFKVFLVEKNLGIGVVLLFFRLLVIGLGVGLSMFDIVVYFGKEEVLECMKCGIYKFG